MQQQTQEQQAVYYLEIAQKVRDDEMAIARRFHTAARRRNCRPELRESYERQMRQHVAAARYCNRQVLKWRGQLRAALGQAA